MHAQVTEMSLCSPYIFDEDDLDTLKQRRLDFMITPVVSGILDPLMDFKGGGNPGGELS